MKKVFVTEYNQNKYSPKDLFPLARPFLQQDTNEIKNNLEKTGINDFSALNLIKTQSLNDADIVLVSEPLTHRQDKTRYLELSKLNRICSENNILAYVFIAGDYGKVHPCFSNIIYYRMGGFKSQLDKNNKAFFPLLGDQLKNIFNLEKIVSRRKKEVPIVGFCGHATDSIQKLIYEKVKLAQINAQRLLIRDFNFEPLFSSAYERYKLLNSLGRSGSIETNFIFRKKYRAGAKNSEERRKTTIEYYKNIIESDYIPCLRGAGNFSVRLYETLMMGRIPVFVNTDCLLPLENEIDWKKHVVWIEWKDRKSIAARIAEFHAKLTENEFSNLQLLNRKLWLESLTVRNFLQNF